MNRSAGDIWHVYGPCMYRPRIETELLQLDDSTTYPENTNLIMKAKHDFTSKDQVHRKAGDLYVIKDPRYYLCDVNETILEVNLPIILSSLQSIKLTAKINMTDVYGKVRKAGDVWLITKHITASHTLNLHEQLVERVDATVLS